MTVIHFLPGVKAMIERQPCASEGISPWL